MPNPLRFIWIWVSALVILSTLVVAVTYVVDPYDVFGTPRRADLNLLKPGAKNRSMLAKTYQIGRARPATVLIGASSTHIGVDAADPAWPAAMRPVFNYAIPGGYSMATNLITLREAISVGDVKQAVVFLEVQNFLVPQHGEAVLTEDDRRLHLLADGRPNADRPIQVARDIFLSLFTMGALVDSAVTVLGQGKPDTLDLAPNGSSTEAVFINAARADGMHDLFAQKVEFDAARVAFSVKAMTNWQGPLPNLDIVADLIEMARAHHVHLIVVITPRHVDALEQYYGAGLWPRVEQAKAELADLVARKGGGDVVLWDFLDYTPYATEVVPAAGDRHTPTKWFWESTHFKKTLGHLMIARINGAPSPDFGAILTPDSVAARNKAVLQQRGAFICGANAGAAGSKIPAGDACPAAAGTGMRDNRLNG
jgi:hypothetical protein